MYAVVKLGSSQYKVSEGDVIKAPRLTETEGKSVALDKVLLYVDGANIKIGQPYLDDVKVTAKVVKQCFDKKVVAFKYRRRKDSATKKGHRQKVTALNITKITVNS